MAKKAPTRTEQHVLLGAGFALGCLAAELPGLSSNRLTLEQAFRYAWPRWEGARQFPAVRVSLTTNDIFDIVERSAGRKGRPVAFFRAEPGFGFVAALRPGVASVTDAAATLEAGCGVSLTAWRALAEYTATGFFTSDR